MLYVEGEEAVREFDRRFVTCQPAFLYIYIRQVTVISLSFRQVAPFGRDTIRKFSDNVSEMKKLAARDFEDILQVCSTYCLTLGPIITVNL